MSGYTRPAGDSVVGQFGPAYVRPAGGSVVGQFGDTGSPAPSATRLKAWDGTAWVPGTLRRWSGSAWVSMPLRRWDGAAWALV